MKLTKAQQKAMHEVERLVALERKLTDDEREFVLDNFQEGAKHDNAAMGAFFTPGGLARDFATEVSGGAPALIDLCAGIGALSYACEEKAERIVCVESCADYVRIGRKVMPDAVWIHADVFGEWRTQLPPDLRTFDYAISNPPFGNRIKSQRSPGRYTGNVFEYRVIELASCLAEFGRFIVPQSSAPFVYSGQPCYRESVSTACRNFMKETGIQLEANCGIDTATYRNAWHGTSPMCEIVLCDFATISAEATPETTASTALTPPQSLSVPADQLDLFADAA